MKLLTQELLRTIPPLYSQENEVDPICHAKFFMPDGAFSWFVIEGSTREKAGCGWGVNCHHRPLTEYDPAHDDVLFFGYVTGLEAELGYFTLSELTAIRGMLACRWNGTGISNHDGCLRSRPSFAAGARSSARVWGGKEVR